MANQPLPEFKRPPLVEVVLGVQFELLENLRSPQMGLLWQRFRKEFPQIEEQPPIEPATERFQPVGTLPRLVVNLQPVLTPRLLFLSEKGTQLLQVQQDRFVQNWRKLDEDQVYPRYEGTLKMAFAQSLKEFESFLQEEGLGLMRPTQCEVTYVNLVSTEEAQDLADVLGVLNYDGNWGFLPRPEAGQVSLRFVMAADGGEPQGRLHVVAEPRVRLPDGEQVHRLTLTARGAPIGEGTEGALRFLDVGHEWVVRGFSDLTTVRMHEHWGRTR